MEHFNYFTPICLFKSTSFKLLIDKLFLSVKFVVSLFCSFSKDFFFFVNKGDYKFTFSFLLASIQTVNYRRNLSFLRIFFKVMGCFKILLLFISLVRASYITSKFSIFYTNYMVLFTKNFFKQLVIFQLFSTLICYSIVMCEKNNKAALFIVKKDKHHAKRDRPSVEAQFCNYYGLGNDQAFYIQLFKSLISKRDYSYFNGFG